MDPSTCILELAVHVGFDVLDRVPYVLTQLHLMDTGGAKVVTANDVPNANWLVPGTVSAAQQQFGSALLGIHPFVFVPSVVSRFSWNVVFNPVSAEGKYKLVAQHAFALDGRLNKAA